MKYRYEKGNGLSDLLDTILPYVGPVLIFAAAIVGIVGDTRDSSKNGWKKLTVPGYIAALIAVGGLSLSVYQVYGITKRDTIIKAVAYSSIRTGWGQMIVPFHRVLWHLKSKRIAKNVLVFAQLRNENNLRKANKIDFKNSEPPQGLNEYDTWAEVLCKPTNEGFEIINSAIENYRDVIEIGVVKMIGSLSRDIRKRQFSEIVPCGSSRMDLELIDWSDEHTIGYMGRLERLGNLVAK